MKNFLIKLGQKLSSRKLWLAIAGVITGIAVSLGVEGSSITTVVGSITSAVSAVSYILVEGKIDASRIATAIEKTQDAIETIGKEGDPPSEDE